MAAVTAAPPESVRPGAPPPLSPLPALAPPPEVTARYRAGGWWRAGTFPHDLYRTAACHPERPALVTERVHRPAGRRTTVVSYAQLALYVERFAAALAGLGVVEGDPVAYQLPSWWETAALTLACWRLGALAVPVAPTVRSRALHRILDHTRARVCVVPDVWAGFPHAEALADLAPALPWLRHRVVIGDAAATGAVDFTGRFLRTPHERYAAGRRLGPPRGRPDGAALLLTVAGPGDTFTSVVHSPDSLYAWAGAGRREGGVFHSTLPLTSPAALVHALCGPLAAGGTGVFADVWDPGRCLDLLAGAGVDRAYGSPEHWREVLGAQRREPRSLERLRLVLSGGETAAPGDLPEALGTALGVPVCPVWGSPVLGYGTVSGDDGAAGLLAPGGLELRAGEGPSGLRARGPSVCLARWPYGAAEPLATWEHDDGWICTGETVAGDGDGGVRVAGGARGRGGVLLVPAPEAERELLAHPRVREAVLLPYTDSEYGELPCAVVVPSTEAAPPGLVALREHLARRGVGEAFLPTRLELVGSLPHDGHGEVRREALRAWMDRVRPGTPRPAPD